MSDGVDKQPATQQVPVSTHAPGAMHIDEGFRHWYHTCSCCLGEKYPEIKQALDEEAKTHAEARAGRGEGPKLVKIASTKDVKVGETKQIEVDDDHVVALFNVDGAFYAIDDTCPHQGCPLSDGDLQGRVLTCSCHGSRFDVQTGALLGGPAQRPVTSYPVTISGDDVEITL